MRSELPRFAAGSSGFAGWRGAPGGAVDGDAVGPVAEAESGCCQILADRWPQLPPGDYPADVHAPGIQPRGGLLRWRAPTAVLGCHQLAEERVPGDRGGS